MRTLGCSMDTGLNSVHGPAMVMTDAAPDRVTRSLVEHIASMRFDALPPGAVESCKTFVLDSLGVALCGTRVPQMPVLHELAASWGAGRAARVWGTGQRVPAGTAAFLNGYQIHNQEWDCVHEPAVVHPMAVVLATLLAHSEARGNVDGRRFLLACVLAVDVAATMGCAARNKLRFFRPAMCGAMGATAGLAAIQGLDAATLRSALGLCYSQLSGTMQAHVEGSPVLPMQIGFNTRSALNAVELARRGITGPADFLEGPFGYFTLIDPDWDAAPFGELGRVWRVSELSHKPFPSGRATHGGVDAALTLKAQHGFCGDDVDSMTVLAPPLVIQLVDRAPHPEMAPAYARLCLPYVAATALLTGEVNVEDFEPARVRDAQRMALAKRIHVRRDLNPSLNALAPQRVEITLRDGRELALDLPAVLGAPGRPLGIHRHLEKFRRAASSGLRPMRVGRINDIIAAVDNLELMSDVSELVDLLQFDAP